MVETFLYPEQILPSQPADLGLNMRPVFKFMGEARHREERGRETVPLPDKKLNTASASAEGPAFLIYFRMSSSRDLSIWWWFAILLSSAGGSWRVCVCTLLQLWIFSPYQVFSDINEFRLALICVVSISWSMASLHIQTCLHRCMCATLDLPHF